MDYLHRAIDSMYVWNSQPLRRLEYFSYSILGTIITTALLASISPLLDLEGSFWVVMSLGMLVAAVVHNVYISIVLVSKRLRSMGYAQDHMWWIFGLWLITFVHSWGEPESTVTLCLLGLDIVVSLWLLLTPGENK